jgi:acetyl coenzyme A synthetase (ADP forming)-like protein
MIRIVKNKVVRNMSSEINEQMRPFFSPKSIAIIGASPIKTKFGYFIFQNLLVNVQRGIFKGVIYPVNPKYTEILGVKCFKSLKDVPTDVETIVISIPAEAVIDAMEEAVDKRAKAAIIITAGFSETGNFKLEEKLKKIGSKNNIRIIGPNCLGVYDPYTGMDTIFLPEVKQLSTGEEVVATPRPMPGNIALITQSGAFGIAALDYMAGHNMGISRFVSYGNRCDVGELELLQYLADDEKTKVILLHLESVVEGRRFVNVAKNVTMKKPIIALKAGKTMSGARAAASHTASLTGVDKIYDAAFEQTGIVRAETIEEFFDMAKALLYQPPAEGNRVAILTDGGGAGVIATDICEESGLIVEVPSKETSKKFEELKAKGELPPFTTLVNPIDLTGSATSKMYEEALKILLEDVNIDVVVLIVLHHVPAVFDDVIDSIAQISKKYSKPVVACDIGGTEMAEMFRDRFEKLGIPAYTTPERAARAAYSLVKYGKYVKKYRDA